MVPIYRIPEWRPFIASKAWAEGLIIDAWHDSRTKPEKMMRIGSNIKGEVEAESVLINAWPIFGWSRLRLRAKLENGCRLPFIRGRSLNGRCESSDLQAR